MIPFVLRLRENQFVLREGYAAMPISVIARHRKVREKMIVKGRYWLGCQNETLSSSVRLVVMRIASPVSRPAPASCAAAPIAKT